MSLWTPSGEHPIDKTSKKKQAAAKEPTTPPTEPAQVHEQERQVVLDELRRELVETPADVVVANHCYGLFELAAVYLSQSPPLLPQAQLAIDALGSIVEGLGDRLGESHASLKDALAQIRLAFVQLQAADAAMRDTGNGSGHEPDG